MKKPKGQWKENLIEGIVELVFCLVLFGLGTLVIGLFGVSADDVDGDLIVLIGVGVSALFGGVIWVAEILKKKKKPSDKQDDDSGN